MRTLERAFARLASTLVVIAVAALGCACAADAATFAVDSTVDAPLAVPPGTTCVSTHEGTCTLRAAVQAADNSGGANTIIVPSGEYKLSIARTGGEDEPANGDLDVSGTSLTITGAGSGATIITGSEADRVFRVHEGAGLQISGVTVQHGGASQVEVAKGLRSGVESVGGAFLNEGTLTISHCVLSHDHANEFGGAVFASKNAVSTTILSTTADHDTSENGGAVFAGGGSLTVEGDVIDNDEAERGGAVDVEDFAEEAESEPASRPVRIARSELSDDTATGANGGAVYLGAIDPAHRDGGEVTVLDSTLDSDTSGESPGGAIADILYGKLAIEASEVSKDKSGGEESGGAIYVFHDESLTVRESAFFEDTGRGGAITGEETELNVSDSDFNGDSGAYGGAIDQGTGGTGSVTTSTFTNNEGTSDGGAIYLYPGAQLSVSASTFDGNLTPGEGGGIAVSGEGHFAFTNDTFESNDAYAGGAISLGEASESGRTMLNDTIVRNHASASGSGINFPIFSTTIEDTIVIENSGASECNESASGAAVGGDIGEDDTCFGEAGGSQVVETLDHNGGPVETDAIAEGSLADGSGVPGSCAPTDARGVVRPSEHCDPGAYQVGSYTAPPEPAVTTEGASAVSNTAATLYATVNPDSTEVISCEIEYGLTSDYEAGAPCSPAPGEGSTPVLVAASVEGLEKATTYHYRVVVTTAGEGREVGADATFETADGTTTTTTTTTSSSSTATTTSSTTTTTTTSTKSTSPPPAQPCRSRRVQSIGWRVRPGVRLARIRVTVNGRAYATLRGSARKTTVSLAGIPKGTVVVRVVGLADSGRRYTLAFTFHTCVPAISAGRVPVIPYLRRAA